MSSPCCLLPRAPPCLQTLLLPLPPTPGGFTALPSRRRGPRGGGPEGPRGSPPNGRKTGGLRPFHAMMLPAVDPWAPTMDSQSVASQLFAASLFPYLGFLYFITKSNTAPKLTLFGFYFLLAFVGVTSFLLHLLTAWVCLFFVIAQHDQRSSCWNLREESFFLWLFLFLTGNKFIPSLFSLIYDICQHCWTAKVQYGTSLSSVDWLHGSAESLLVLTNLFIVLGLREALRKVEDAKNSKDEVSVDVQKEKQSSV